MGDRLVTSGSLANVVSEWLVVVGGADGADWLPRFRQSAPGQLCIQVDIPDFSNSVLTHLNQLRVQGRLCDIVVNVQGQSFRAHKVVLAASSPYFRDHMSLSQMNLLIIILSPRAGRYIDT
uniref:BTB domain-containing protein n=1 Tax=Neogobius melanostomus TaxID=47308 RepID=A0A8C6UBN5_9GOBI